MSRGGLAALAGLLKGVGTELPKHVDAYNAGVASQNRDNVLGWAEESSRKWAEEQAKIRKIETQASAAGVPLPEDPVERNAALASVGADPDASLPFEQWAAKKQASREGVAQIQTRLNEGGAGLKVDGVAGSKTRKALAAAIQREKEQDDNDPYLQDAMERGGMSLEGARALRADYQAKRDAVGPAGDVAAQASAAQGFMGGGKAEVGQKTTNREWTSETADAIRPAAVANMKKTLGRSEQDTSDLEIEEGRLRYKHGLLQPYTSRLGEKDLSALLDELRLAGETKKARDAANEKLRGDQTQIGTAIIGADRAMAQTALSADARASEGAANRDTRVKVANINQAGANGRTKAKIDSDEDKTDNKLLAAGLESARKALNDRIGLSKFVARSKSRREDDLQREAAALGLPMIPGGWFRNGKLDPSSVNTDVKNSESNYNDWNAKAREAAQVDGKKPSPSGNGKGGGTSGRKSLSDY